MNVGASAGANLQKMAERSEVGEELPKGGAVTGADSHWLAYGALAAVSFFWGTTYLGIRMSLESFPPFWLIAVRYTISGGLMLAGAMLAGARIPRGRELAETALFGTISIGIGNGALSVAELWIPSGMASLFITTSPFWMVGIDWARCRSSKRPGSLTVRGLLVGLLRGHLSGGPIGGGRGLARQHYERLPAIATRLGGMASWARCCSGAQKSPSASDCQWRRAATGNRAFHGDSRARLRTLSRARGTQTGDRRGVPDRVRIAGWLQLRLSMRWQSCRWLSFPSTPSTSTRSWQCFLWMGVLPRAFPGSGEMAAMCVIFLGVAIVKWASNQKPVSEPCEGG